MPRLRNGPLLAVLLALVAPEVLAIDTIVVFNEIQYHPEGGGDPGMEFVELVNQNSVNIDHQGAIVGTDTITVTNTGEVEPASALNTVVSEIHYHPAGDLAEEFLELRNIHPSAFIDLTGVSFSSGIGFDFAPGTSIAPGGYLLLVQDLTAFNSKYGAGLPVAGIFQGLSRLSNGGERIRIEAAGGIAILRSARTFLVHLSEESCGG